MKPCPCGLWIVDHPHRHEPAEGGIDVVWTCPPPEPEEEP